MNARVRFAAWTLGSIALLCGLGPLFSPYDAAAPDLYAISLGPSWAHPFGTDSLGRDLLTRVLEGGRLSLLVGLAATAVSLLVGVSWGAVAGYLGGRVDALMMRIVDVLYGVPFVFLVILLMVAFGRDVLLIFVAIGLINWLDTARIVRGQTLSLKQRPYVLAARGMGLPTARIIARYIVPNLLGVVLVYATLTIPQVILVESFLSFLGLGVQEPATSWGVLVNEGAQEMENAPWMLVFPGAFLALTLYAFNALGDGLRDRVAAS